MLTACRIRSRRTSSLWPARIRRRRGKGPRHHCHRRPRRASLRPARAAARQREASGAGRWLGFPGARVALRGSTRALAATETAGGGRGRGALGLRPEQPHPARAAEAPADPLREPSTTRGGEGKGGGSGGAQGKGDGAAHGVEQLVELATACVVTHGVAGRRRRGAEGVWGSDRVGKGIGDSVIFGFDVWVGPVISTSAACIVRSKPDEDE
jgi:hypothetical protein